MNQKEFLPSIYILIPNAEGWHNEVVTEGVDKYPKSDYNALRMKNPISDISR